MLFAISGLFFLTPAVSMLTMAHFMRMEPDAWHFALVIGGLFPALGFVGHCLIWIYKAYRH